MGKIVRMLENIDIKNYADLTTSIFSKYALPRGRGSEKEFSLYGHIKAKNCERPLMSIIYDSYTYVFLLSNIALVIYNYIRM